MADYADNVLTVQNAKYGKDVRQALVEIFQHHEELLESFDEWLTRIENSIGEDDGGGESNRDQCGMVTATDQDIMKYPAVSVVDAGQVTDYNFL